MRIDFNHKGKIYHSNKIKGKEVIQLAVHGIAVPAINYTNVGEKSINSPYYQQSNKHNLIIHYLLLICIKFKK